MRDGSPDVAALFVHFTLLTAVAFGGLPVVMPDMQRYLVDVQGWMSARQFTEIYALAQAAPAPNVMYVTVLGWIVAGWAGAVATTLALFLPGSVIASSIIALHARNPEAKLGRAVRRGLSPVTIGLVLSSGWVFVNAADHDWRGYLLTLATIGLVLKTRLNPVWLIASGAAAGVIGLV